MERRKPEWLKRRTIQIPDTPPKPKPEDEEDREEDEEPEYRGHGMNLGTIIGLIVGLVVLLVGLQILTATLTNMETGTNMTLTNTVVGPTLSNLPVLIGIGSLVLAIGWAIMGGSRF